MSPLTIIIVVLALTALAFHVGKRRSLGVATRAGSVRKLHSLPSYYGTLTALWCGVPALIVLGLWVSFESSIITWLVVAELPRELRDLPEEQLGLLLNDIRNLRQRKHRRGGGGLLDDERGGALREASRTSAAPRSRSSPFPSRWPAWATAGVSSGRACAPAITSSGAVMAFLIISSLVAIFTTIGIVLSVLFEAIRFFGHVPFPAFMFGLEWSPQTAIREDQVGSSGAFGAVPLFAGTLLISAIAMAIAAPIGLFAAIYLAEYADPRVRALAKPLLEILAGIPTVVYGFFAALTVAPIIRETGESLGMSVSSESALAAGFVMGLMLIPFISSLSDDVINAVPQSCARAPTGSGRRSPRPSGR